MDGVFTADFPVFFYYVMAYTTQSDGVNYDVISKVLTADSIDASNGSVPFVVVTSYMEYLKI